MTTDLQGTIDKMHAEIDEKNIQIEQKQGAADRLRHFAENEADEDKQQGRWAAFDKAQAEVDVIHEEVNDNHVLVMEYEIQLRAVHDASRVGAARLESDQANADLLAAIKRDQNWGTTLTDLATKKIAVMAKITKEQSGKNRTDKIAKWTKSIGDMNERKTKITMYKDKMADKIVDLTKRVSKADAGALTIGA